MFALLAFLLVQAAALKFDDYPALAPLKGAPARPILKTARQRTYRTRIRDAAKEAPNFAGHFKIAEWGCGSGCVSIVIIDEQTGAVYDPPFEVLSFSSDNPPLTYKLESRLLIARGCPEEKNCASYSYEWTGARLKLLRKDAM